MKLKKFNCSPKLNQEVVLPTRQQVFDICSEIESKIKNQVFLIDELAYTLGMFIAKKFRVNVLHAQAWEVEPTELNINAYYDPDLDERGKISIELILVTNPNDDHLILDDALWKLFVYRLADSLAHELIHMYQARCREFLHVENL